MFFAAEIGMAPAEESRKLLCRCTKPLGTFTVGGLELHCRHCKEVTTVPYGIASLRAAIEFVEQLRRRFFPGRGPRI